MVAASNKQTLKRWMAFQKAWTKPKTCKYLMTSQSGLMALINQNGRHSKKPQKRCSLIYSVGLNDWNVAAPNLSSLSTWNTLFEFVQQFSTNDEVLKDFQACPLAQFVFVVLVCEDETFQPNEDNRVETWRGNMILLIVQKSQTTTWNVQNPVNNWIFTISTGAGVIPSTVSSPLLLDIPVKQMHQH